jgi:hypothetical protein
MLYSVLQQGEVSKLHRVLVRREYFALLLEINKDLKMLRSAPRTLKSLTYAIATRVKMFHLPS